MADLDVDHLVLLIYSYQKVTFLACVLSLQQFAARHKVRGVIDPSVPFKFHNRLRPPSRPPPHLTQSEHTQKTLIQREEQMNTVIKLPESHIRRSHDSL